MEKPDVTSNILPVIPVTS